MTPLPAYDGEDDLVFMCYAHADRRIVDPDIRWLQDGGINVWYDEGIEPGSVWRRKIAESLDRAVALIFFASEASYESDYCRQEISYATDAKKRIYVVKLDDSEMPSDFKLTLGERQMLTWDADLEYRHPLYRALLNHDTLFSQGTVPSEARRKRRRSKRLSLTVGIGVIFIGSAMLGWPPQLERPELMAAVANPAAPSETSVAVLPFDVMSDADAVYLAEGLAEEIINILTQVSGLYVAARTSTFSLAARDVDVLELGSHLMVGSVLDGEIRRDNGDFTINAQLIDVASGRLRWSRTFNRSAQDVFEVQSEIATAVVESLEIGLTNVALAERQPSSFAAFDRLLRGRSALKLRTEQAVREGLALIQQAIELDPTYARAYADLSTAYHSLYAFTAENRNGPTLALAEEAVRRALALDADDFAAHAALGDVVKIRHHDYVRADLAYRRALEINPGFAAGYEMYGASLTTQGRADEALAMMRRGLHYDPLSPLMHRQVGRLLWYTGRPAEAVDYLLRALELNPDDHDAPPLLWATYTWMGEQEAAREAFLAGLDPPYRPFVRALSRTLGDRRLARIGLWLQDLGKQVPCGSNASASAQAWAWLGEADRMYECLDISSPRAYGYLKLNPVYEPYRSTRRFRDLLRQANLEPGPAAAAN